MFIDWAIRECAVTDCERGIANLDISDPPGHELAVNDVVASRDSTQIVSASFDGTIIVWDTSSASFVEERLAHKGSVKSLSLSPDGRRLVSAGGVVGETFVVWDILKGVHRVAAPRGHTKTVTTCDWSFDGTLIVSASEDGTVRVWDALTFEQLEFLDDQRAVSKPDCLMFTGDARCLAWVSQPPTNGGECHVWMPSTKERSKVLPARPSVGNVPVHALAVDNRRVATAYGGTETNGPGGYEDCVARIWDGATGTALGVLIGHKGAVSLVGFSPGGASVLTASWDGSVKIWDIDSGHEIASFSPLGGEVQRACFSPDRRRITTASETTVQLWKTDGISCVAMLAEYEKHWSVPFITEMAFSLDGEFLAFGRSDGFVHFRRLSDFVKDW